MKSARVEEQQERKQWAKRQQIKHSYGLDDDSDDSDTEIGPLPTIQSTAIADGALLVVSDFTLASKKSSLSSSKTMPMQINKSSRITFRYCPLNKSAVRH